MDKTTEKFIRALKEIFKEELVSVTLYGSAASGEFVKKHSNLNLLVVLKDTSIRRIKPASKLVNKFKSLSPIFLTEYYISKFLDVFPIEFLDMQENYSVLYGKDVLKDLKIDTKNLRFQCEQELKLKLLNLKQAYLRIGNDKSALRELLFKSFTSALHVLRSVLRLKGKKPAYKKEDFLKELGQEFKLNMSSWSKILAGKLKLAELSGENIEDLFIDFIGDLEEIISAVDGL